MTLRTSKLKSLEENSNRADAASLDLRSAANAALVNRTHRVLRERAKSISERNTRLRSLWIPLAVCAALLVILCTGVWTALAQNDISPTGIPDASDQMLVFLLWFFPVSAALLAMVWFNRARNTSGSESAR